LKTADQMESEAAYDETSLMEIIRPFLIKSRKHTTNHSGDDLWHLTALAACHLRLTEHKRLLAELAI
jgi:hypothetical protein